MPNQVRNHMQQMEFFEHTTTTTTIQLFFHHLQDMRFDA